MVGQRVGETLYHLLISADNNKEPQDFASAANLSIGIVHQRFAHLNCSDIIRMQKTNAVKNLGLEGNHSRFTCEACIFGKMHRIPFPTEGSEKAAEVCDLIHADVGGSIHAPTFDDYKLYSLLKDNNSNYIDVKLINKKSEVVDHIIEFYERMKTQTGKQIKVLRTDQGREYGGERMESWKRQKVVIHQTTNRYTPQQNGVSERANRTLMDGVRSSMYNNSDSNHLPDNTGSHLMELWGEFLCATVYVKNRSISSHSNITPYEKVFGKKPSVGHLRILSCRAPEPPVPNQAHG